MNFINTKVRVSNRGVPPDSFLVELVEWVKLANNEIFAPRPVPIDLKGNVLPDGDIYTRIRPTLGPWQGLLHRKAAFCEVARVHAGFESTWNWNESVDKTNKTSMENRTGEETGIFQVSFDSEHINHDFMRSFAINHDIDTAEKFIPRMKSDHKLALEYYARLIRVNFKWAGPLIRNEITPWLSRASMNEFQSLVA